MLDVLVHIDPEDDMDPDTYATRLPARDKLLAELQPLLTGLPEPQKVVLHYLKGQVEAEVFYSHLVFENGEALREAEDALSARLKQHPAIRCVSLNCLIAP